MEYIADIDEEVEMKLRLVQNPHISRFLWLVEIVEGEEVKRKNILKETLLTPIRTTLPAPDSLIVQGIKIASGNPNGFATWEDAAQFIAGITDARTYAADLGHDIESLLNT